MRRSCNFQPNPALFAGAALLWISVFIRNVLELGGDRKSTRLNSSHWS